jgi:hypothetical protein
MAQLVTQPVYMPVSAQMPTQMPMQMPTQMPTQMISPQRPTLQLENKLWVYVRYAVMILLIIVLIILIILSMTAECGGTMLTIAILCTCAAGVGFFVLEKGKIRL